MKEVNYLEIFKKSLQATWRKKLLWFFGFFILIGSGGNGFVFNWKPSETFTPGNILEGLVANKLLLSISILLILVLMIALTALKIIGQAAIIIFSGYINPNKEIGFSALFKKGKHFLWKLLLLDVLFAFSLLILLVTLSLPVVFLVFVKSNLLALFIGISALLILIPVYVLAYFIKRFSYIYIVLSDLDIKSSIENSYIIFKDNILRCLIFSMLLIGSGIILGLFLISLMVVIGMPLILLGLALSFVFSKIGLYFSLGAGLLLVGTIFLLSQSAFEAFRQIAWTFFFKELAGMKIEKAEMVASPVAEEMPKPEQA
ncbi:MAG TPA: hypothetical protein DCX32_04285 [Candidatus Moranbacteria bacterium]|nr:MAG: hypothetical protein UW95_C0024G0022 [Parcubacteria group bacterium GW2011_GWC1_45_14]HAV11726.1 hypothetical protein [Candidatus Moranbacteria bacterium]